VLHDYGIYLKEVGNKEKSIKILDEAYNNRLSKLGEKHHPHTMESKVQLDELLKIHSPS